MLAFAGLSVAWIGGLAIFFTITWQLTLFALPSCIWMMFLGYRVRSSDGRLPRPNDLALMMAWCFSLPVLHATGLWWLFLLLELMAFMVFAIPTAESEYPHVLSCVISAGLASLPGSLTGAMWTSGGRDLLGQSSGIFGLWIYLVPFTLVSMSPPVQDEVPARINMLVLAMLPLQIEPDLQSVPSLGANGLP